MDDGADDKVEPGSAQGLAVKGAVSDFAALMEEDGRFEVTRSAQRSQQITQTLVADNIFGIRQPEPLSGSEPLLGIGFIDRADGKPMDDHPVAIWATIFRIDESSHNRVGYLTTDPCLFIGFPGRGLM